MIKEIVAIFLGIFIPSSERLFANCKIFSNVSFDSQALLTWEYASWLKILPYKDIFYPYGLLSYYKNVNILFGLISFLIIPTLYVSFFIHFKKIIKNRFLAYFSFLVFFLFIESFVGEEAFLRYGILVSVSLLFAYEYFKNKQFSIKINFIFGIISGIIFSLSYDQGILVVISFNLCFIFFHLLNKQTKKLFTKEAFISICVFFLGLVVAVLPFFLYLYFNQSIGAFIETVRKSSDIGLYAKTPFPPYAKSFENVFVLGALFFCLFHILKRRFLENKALGLTEYFQIVLVIVLVLLEQKNIIRSIDRQVTFIGLILYLLILTRKNILLSIFLLIAILLPFKHKPLYFSTRLPATSEICIEKNVASFLSKNPNYKETINRLEVYDDFNKKVFSFPSDPIFYITFNQVPPYYFNTYDGSALYAQKTMIDYIEKNNVKYAIYNSEIKSTQDGVPDYIRAAFINEYLLTNFSIIDNVDGFLILKRAKAVDIFSRNDPYQSKIQSYLRNINLGSIPLSEGLYKNRYIKDEDIIIQSDKEEDISRFLVKSSTTSRDLFIVLVPNKEHRDIIIELSTISGGLTKINISKCVKKKMCIIHLSRIPLFYKERVLKYISFKNNFDGNIKLVRIKKNQDFW